MSETVSDFLVKRLQEWGATRLYGYPGDGINGILGALDRAGDKPRFIQARHEELAAFMACAHAKFTGEVGVCLATSGPGAIHLLNGLYDAKMDHVPVVAIVGQAARPVMGASYQQEVDLHMLFKDVAHEFVVQVQHAAGMRVAIDRAFRTAMDQRSVTCVIIPKDLQEKKAIPQAAHTHDRVNSSTGYSVPMIIPRDRDLRRAAEILNSGKRVGMLVGQGAMGATQEVMEIAEILGAGVAKAWLGKAVIPDDVPYCTGAIGLLGTKPSYDMMMNCDTLLMVGTTFPYIEFLPKPGQARAVQIDIDGRNLGIRYPTEVNLKGDAAVSLRVLLPFLEYKKDRSFQQGLIDGMQTWWKVLEKQAMQPAKPINPERVFHELSPKLPHDCILCADSGTAANWYARDLKIRKGMMASGSGNLATMGPAVPYAVAAKFCFPDRVAIACTGDGAMQMNGLNSCITVAKYWREWSDPRWICLVLNNRDLNQVTWEQRVMSGNPKFEASQNLPDFPYAKFAESLGLRGIRVDNPDDITDAWSDALASDRPVIYEAIVDPDVPTLPPHITFKQAKNFLSAIVEGEPDVGHMVKESAQSMMARLVGSV